MCFFGKRWKIIEKNTINYAVRFKKLSTKKVDNDPVFGEKYYTPSKEKRRNSKFFEIDFMENLGRLDLTVSCYVLKVTNFQRKLLQILITRIVKQIRTGTISFVD